MQPVQSNPVRLLPLAAACWLLLGACETGESHAPYQAIPLEQAMPMANQGPQLFRHYIPGKGSPLWSMQASESRFTQVPRGARQGKDAHELLKPAFLLMGPEPKRLSLHDPFDPQDFNRVEVEATVFQTGLDHIHVELYRDGSRLSTSPSLVLRSRDRSPTRLVFDFPEMLDWFTPFDEIRIVMPGPAAMTTVSKVSLYKVHPRDCLAPSDPHGAVRYVSKGAETRRSWIMETGTSLSSQMNWKPGGALQFSYALLDTLSIPSKTASLNFQARLNGKQVARGQWPIQKTSGWQTLRMDTHDWGTGTLNLSFSLTANDKQLTFVALGEPAFSSTGVHAPSVVLVTTEGLTHSGPWDETLDGFPRAARDRISDGLRFLNAIPSHSGRIPGLVALMTGRAPGNTGFLAEDNQLSPKAHTLAEVFRAGGYRTLAVVSDPAMAHDSTGLAQGFDRYSAPVEGIRSALDATHLAHEWLTDGPKGPTFLWLHLPAPNPADGMAPCDLELTDLLAMPELRDCIFAFTCTTANRATTSQRPIGSLHVPLAFALPTGLGGIPSSHPVQTEDLGKTLIQAAGLTDESFPGRDLVDLVTQSLPNGRDLALLPRFQVDEGQTSVALNSGDWLAVLHVNPSSTTTDVDPEQPRLHPLDLYELGPDPRCMTNVLQESPPQARLMHSAITQWMEEQESLDWLGSTHHLGTCLARIHRQAFGQVNNAKAPLLPPRLRLYPLRAMEHALSGSPKIPRGITTATPPR